MLLFLPGIYLAALLHGIFIISLLLKHSKNRTPNIFLSMFILMLMIALWNISILSLDVPPFLKFRIIDHNIFATPYFWGPCLYLYIQKLVNKHTSTWSQTGWHFTLPALIVISQPLLPDPTNYPIIRQIVFFGFYIHVAFYLVLSFRCLYAHQKRVQDTFSQLDGIYLNWLKRLLGTFVLALIIDAALATLVAFNILDYGLAAGSIVLLESCTIFIIGYFSLQQPEIIFPLIEQNTHPKKKYDNSAIDEPLAKEPAGQLRSLMEHEKPYKKNDLKLHDLAAMMNLSNHHVSQIINDQLGCNFYEFINRYRVNYAASLMQDQHMGNLTGLAFDAGFNNRVSFTNAFKKYKGVTPSDYLKSLTLKQAS